jgi:hypothetical protein
MLSQCFSESLAVGDRELIHRLFPVKRGATPIGGDVSKGQPDELGGRLIAREMAARFDDLSQPRIHALNGVGGVDDASHRRREP